MKYAVVTCANFEDNLTIALFDNYDKAKEYLNSLWENSYNIELAESIVGLDESECYCDNNYGKIQWDDGDYMEFALTNMIKEMY